MACSVRVYNSILAHNLIFKNKYLPRLLCNRHLCSKDNEVKSEIATATDSSSNKNEKEGAKKDSSILKNSRLKAKPVTEETKEMAKQKLKSLLSEITISTDGPEKSGSKLNIAKAQKRISKKERLKQMQEAEITPEKKISMAIKAVASNFKEDSEKVESELKEKLTTLNLTKEVPSEEAPEAVKVEDTKASPLIDDQLSANLMTSVEKVADAISENPIPSRSELTKRLMRLSLDKKIKSEQKPVKSVIKGMVIKSKESDSTVPEEERKQIADERRMIRRKFPVTKRAVNLFGASPLNIFEPGSESRPDSSNLFWQNLQERELRLLTQFAPANAFEEMIMWTEQGKHWKFPIDNETEMGDEENVGFHEHVFLEHHLKGFPTRGPVRHFMELVCVGLSKNPYISVERKIENIEWFRNYFKEKEEILKDAGVLE